MANRTMIIEFTTFYFMFWWVMSVLYKDNLIHRKLEQLGIRIGHKTKVGSFICSLGECKFCIESHTATILAISYYSYCLDYRCLIWGFICSSINSWFRTFLR